MRLAILTSDKYVDAIPWSLKALRKYWGDCPYPVDVVYTIKEPDTSGFDVLKCGIEEDKGWIGTLSSYIWIMANVGAWKHDPNILLMLDDYITVNVNRNLMAIAEQQLMREDVGMVRLVPTPGPTMPCNYHEEVGEMYPYAKYSLSLQASMWNVDTLAIVVRKLTDKGCKSAWDFELKGSKALADWDIKEKFLGLHRGAISYKNLYRRGKIQEDVYEWMKKNL